MDSDKIDELLSRYWNCETSLAEEKQLQTYFKDGVASESLKEVAALFRYFEDQRKKQLHDLGFDGQMVKRLGERKQIKMSNFFYKPMRIAAGIAVLMIAVWFVRNEIREASPEPAVDTYDDPKLAFEETKKALLMISKTFGKAEEQAKKINLFNEAQEEIRKREKEVKL